jgi:hypothetical protein
MKKFELILADTLTFEDRNLNFLRDFSGFFI